MVFLWVFCIVYLSILAKFGFVGRSSSDKFSVFLTFRIFESGLQINSPDPFLLNLRSEKHGVPFYGKSESVSIRYVAKSQYNDALLQWCRWLLKYYSSRKLRPNSVYMYCNPFENCYQFALYSSFVLVCLLNYPAKHNYGCLVNKSNLSFRSWSID